MKEPASSLRRRAQSRLDDPHGTRAAEPLAASELDRIVQELHVHQIELELQNEELEKARRRLEDSRAAVAASERRYRELFERAPVGYLRLDQKGAILEANQTVAMLLAAGTSQLAGRKLTDFIARQSQDAYHLYRRAALSGEDPHPARVALRALDGELRDVEIGARAIDGDRAELHIAILDVTARERAEAERYESERQRRLMADLLPLAITVVAADGRHEFCNRKFETLCGLPAGAIEGRSIHEVFDLSVYSALRDHVRAALAGEAARFEGELSFPGTGSRFVSAIFAPDRAPDGRVRGLCALIDDRTDLEEARRGLRVAAAQAALAEQRERRALAADLHDDVGQLLALALIRLREYEKNVPALAQARPLREIADLMRTVRRRISTLSFELSPPLLYDVGFVAAAQWLAENLEHAYGLKVEIDTAGEVPALDEASRVSLFRALRELLINVAKHSGVHRSYVSICGDIDGVTVVVEDRGVGFVPAVGAGGFGLQNVLVRIESLGGRVGIESEPGQGTRVSLRVPAHTEAIS